MPWEKTDGWSPRAEGYEGQQEKGENENKGIWRKLGSDGCVYYLDYIDDFMVYTYFKTSNVSTKVFTGDFVFNTIQQKPRLLALEHNLK